MALGGGVCVRAGGAVVNDRLLSDQANGSDWAAYGRTFGEDHFSPLAQIDARNVARLGLVWWYDLPKSPSVTGAPLEVDGVLYFAVGFSVVRAMDAVTGRLLWKYNPHVPQVAGQKLRGAWGIRGIAFWKGRVYTGTQDGRLIALDAKTGRLLWSVETTRGCAGCYITGPPEAFDGKVVIGEGGGDLGPVRGYVSAYDARTGKRLWRFYTVPGDPHKGFKSAAMAMAAKTWHGRWWRFGGGGTVWNAMTYDPQFNRLYIGTGNPDPWNPRIRGGGDALFTDSIVALNADSGKLVWYYQEVPDGTWDYDAASDIELGTLRVDGKSRPVLLQASKDGFFYVIDRRTGKLLSAQNFVKVSWARGYDLRTGRPLVNRAARFPHGGLVLVFPGPVGAHAATAMSFNPATRLAYVPATDLGFVYADPPGNLRKWKPRPGIQVNIGVSSGGPPPTVPPGKSALVAWNPVTQRRAWSVPLKGILNGGTMTTAGNLVFQGQITGQFTAYSATDGRKLWSFDGQAGFQGQPITYTVHGKQYITVISGYRGVGGFADPADVWHYETQQRRVLTFALGGTAKLPPARRAHLRFIVDPALKVNPRRAAIGAGIVARHCSLCHGPGLIAGGDAPDLRAAAVPLSLKAFIAVLHGALLPGGMPRFDELDRAQIEDVQQYIRQQARIAHARREAHAH